MLLFVIGMIVLFAGYFVYGRFVERILAPDDRKTPAILSCDGVDFLTLPHWKNMLIQLLNIAGIGPVIGVILGIKFGPIVFIILPIGNILGGAVHDFCAGMLSLRNNGANMPKMISLQLGEVFGRFISFFTMFLLLLVVAVFINIPANLINEMVPEAEIWYLAVGLIFVYYICATLFSVDKIIGNIYPIFGGILIISSFCLFIMLLIETIQSPELLSVGPLFKVTEQPIIPVLFVTIACGIISGFHATQSPIIARTMTTERDAKESFYGMMVLEGVIAMIWAAVGMTIYNLFPNLMNKNPSLVLSEAVNYFLGPSMGIFAIIGVVLLAITSGDTAMRSLRLSIAERFDIKQISIKSRLLVTIPVIIVVLLILIWSNQDEKSFSQLWSYFAWGNQVLAVFTLFASAAWLFKQDKLGWIALLPGMFMLFIVIFYILWVSPEKNGPIGFGLPYWFSGMFSCLLTLLCGGLLYFKYHKK